MITGIIALLCIALGLAALIKGKWQTSPAQEEIRGRGGYGFEPARDAQYINLRPYALATLALGFLALAFSTVYRLDTGQAAVLKPISGNVQPDDTDTTPGFSVKAPWDKVIKYDLRNQSISFYGTDGGVEFNDGEIKDQRITASTDDNADVFIDSTTQYSIDPEKVFDIYRAYPSQDAFKSRKIHPGMRAAQQIPPGDYSTSEIRQRRPDLAADMKKVIETNLGPFGIKVESIDLRAMNFTEAVQKDLNAVQQRKAQTEAARESVNTANLEAEKVRVDAQAQSDADQITRCGATTTQVDVEINGKVSKQTKITPVPINQCQNRLNEQVLTSKYIDMLTVAAEKGNTVYVVPPGGNNLLQLAPQQAK